MYYVIFYVFNNSFQLQYFSVISIEISKVNLFKYLGVTWRNFVLYIHMKKLKNEFISLQ